MHFGLQLPQWGNLAAREPLHQLILSAERAGFGGLWASDHVAIPQQICQSYPYSGSGELPFGVQDGFLECSALLSFAGAISSHMTLGTSVMIASYRHPLLVAKLISTIATLSSRRVILGMGAGWWRDEFSRLGADFDSRWLVLEESLAALRELFENGGAAFHGTIIHFDETACFPRPPETPQLWVGGMGPRALRLVARSADGWQAMTSNAERITESSKLIARHAQVAGRDPSSIAIGSVMALPREPSIATTRIERLHVAGVTHLTLALPRNSLESSCQLIEDFGEVIERMADLVPAERLASTSQRLPHLADPVDLVVRDPQGQDQRHQHRIPQRPR